MYNERLLQVLRSFKAWPLPKLESFSMCHCQSQAGYGYRLGFQSQLLEKLGLPESSCSNMGQLLDEMRTDQAKVLAFVSGVHMRLGAGSPVALLSEQELMIIADKVLGAWTLRTEWQQCERVLSMEIEAARTVHENI